MNRLYCDVLIFGAGIIGSSLALRLGQFGIKVVIIDHKYPVFTISDVKPNIRVSAINYASVEFLKKINIWNKIPSRFYSSYHHLEAWEWSLSKITFHAKSLGLSQMGCIIENNRLQSALWEGFSYSKEIIFYCPVILISINYNGLYWKCVLNNNIIVMSYLLIGADGTNSQIRKKFNIGVSGIKYRQHCMLLSIKTEKCVRGTIWQIFTPDGPIGFLPLYDHWGSLMWYDSPENICYFKQLPTIILEKKLENNFQDKLGTIKLYNIATVPLIYQDALDYITSRGVLIGDAAHTIHPLTGQGINLGFRDIQYLSDLLIKERKFDKFSNIDDILVSYQKNRKNDFFLIQTSIHWLYFMFHNNMFPLKVIRNIVFMTIERFPYLKKKILKYAIGFGI